MYNVNDDNDEKAAHGILKDDMKLNTINHLLNITKKSVIMMTVMMMI